MSCREGWRFRTVEAGVHHGVTKARRQEGEVGAMRTAREASGTMRIARFGNAALIDSACCGCRPCEWSLRQSVPSRPAKIRDGTKGHPADHQTRGVSRSMANIPDVHDRLGERQLALCRRAGGARFRLDPDWHIVELQAAVSRRRVVGRVVCGSLRVLDLLPARLAIADVGFRAKGVGCSRHTCRAAGPGRPERSGAARQSGHDTPAGHSKAQ